MLCAFTCCNHLVDVSKVIGCALSSIVTCQFSSPDYLLKIPPFELRKKWLDISGVPEFHSNFGRDKIFKVLMKTCD